MSFYLKYRPQDFNNLVWQNFVKDTLKKAINNNRLVWAYLLCWPRGTWKTSTARILAKTINCPNQKDWNPCLKCDICKDFIEEKLIDIIEIDAASHTWVDNIRDIIQKAQFNPTSTKYKVYIIDEVHMLSKWAFNALLKILEEPPNHVKFILATTETHKVPETIISRCQRFDFKKITDKDIENRLKFIAENENLEIDKNALSYIVKNSWGWLRNAISLFEQYIVDWKVVYENIKKNLWLVWEDIIKKFYELLLTWNNSVIWEFDKLIDTWINIKLFFKELFFYIKNDSIEKINKWVNINNELFILDNIDETFIKVKNSQDENTTFLISLLKILNYLNCWEIVNTNNLSKKSVIQDKKIDNIEILNNNNEWNISSEDLNDIFGWSISNSSTNNSYQSSSLNKEKTKVQENIKPIDNNTIQNNSLDIAKYLVELKNVWAKWALIFSIKWANCKLEWNVLNIKFKTKFALKTVDTSDNITLLLQWLKGLWIESPEINFL